jgi:hypothetical protein
MSDSLPWWWRLYGPVKCWWTYTGLYSAISQKDSHFRTHRREDLRWNFLDHFINAISLSFVHYTFLVLCFSFRVTCPKFASRTRAVQQYWPLFNSPNKQLTFIDECHTAEGFLCLELHHCMLFYSTLKQCPYTAPFFTADIQRHLTAKLWNSKQKCGEV